MTKRLQGTGVTLAQSDVGAWCTTVHLYTQLLVPCIPLMGPVHLCTQLQVIGVPLAPPVHFYAKLALLGQLDGKGQ